MGRSGERCLLLQFSNFDKQKIAKWDELLFDTLAKLNVEPEVHDIAVLHNVLFPLKTHQSLLLGA